MSAREFRATLSRVEEPVLVGDGIWFPTLASFEAWARQSLDLPPGYVAAPPAAPTLMTTQDEKTQAARDAYVRQQAERDRMLRRMKGAPRQVKDDGRRHPTP
jgi:hypothetical protein